MYIYIYLTVNINHIPYIQTIPKWFSGLPTGFLHPASCPLPHAKAADSDPGTALGAGDAAGGAGLLGPFTPLELLPGDPEVR